MELLEIDLDVSFLTKNFNGKSINGAIYVTSPMEFYTDL